MSKNVGPADRIIRLILGVLFAGVAFTAAGVWAWAAGIVAVIALVTGAIGFCPLYALLRINTNAKALRRAPESR
jgi:hypothetical protein